MAASTARGRMGAGAGVAGVGAHREPDEQRHRDDGAHRHQQLEADAALVQRLAEQPLAGEQNRGAGDE